MDLKPRFEHNDLSEHDQKILKELCELQEKHLEDKNKEIENGTVESALEHNMDILREICCMKHPDPGYVYEKTCLMLNKLNDLGFRVPRCEEYRSKKRDE
jgi:hypothetical protein